MQSREEQSSTRFSRNEKNDSIRLLSHRAHEVHSILSVCVAEI
jgi:hypothetical protein